MRSTAAEVARTLAAGRLPGRLTVTGAAEELAVAHATTPEGTVLIVAREQTTEWDLLARGGEAVLSVDDTPPFPDSPVYPSVHLRGHLERVGEGELRAAGLTFADANPIECLLDLGEGVDLFRLVPGEVWLQKCQARAAVTVEEFTAATPDPLHPDEHHLLADLRDHHAAELSAMVPGGRAVIQPVRLDRYGLMVALPRLARLEFNHPATDAGCVARALRLDHASHG